MTTVDQLFPSERRERLARVRRTPASKWDLGGAPVRERHLVFDPGQEQYAARRAAWTSYIDAADQCGLLDQDLVARLTGTDDDAFRAGIAECMTAWFFSEELGCTIEPRPLGGGGSVLDMSVQHQTLEAHVEVKAPYVPRTWNRWAGDDADALLASIKKAGRQFADGVANLVVLAPTIRTEVYYNRDQLLKALIGEHTIVMPVALEDGVETPEPYPGFLQSGKLAKLRGAGENVFTDLTRISAVMSLEEAWVDGRLEPRVVVVHNPFGAVPIANTIFDPYPQWIRDGDEMYWIPPRKPA